MDDENKPQTQPEEKPTKSETKLISGVTRLKLANGRRESAIEARLRVRRQESATQRSAEEQKAIDELIKKELDPNTPIKNALGFINDSTELTGRVIGLMQNEGIQAAILKIDELVAAGDAKAVSISESINMQCKAFERDMVQNKKLCDSLSTDVQQLAPLIENSVGGQLSGELLQQAVKLDSVASAANWMLSSAYAVTAQAFVDTVNDAVNYTKDVNQQAANEADATNVNVITDVKPKEIK